MKRSPQALVPSPFFFLRAVALAVLLAAGPAGAAPVDPYEIRLLDRTFVPTPMAPAAVQTFARQGADLAAKGQNTVHVLVQLQEVPSVEQKGELWRDELDLGAYATGSAWIAAVPAARLGEVAARPEVRWLALWDADRKLHPRVRKGEYGAWTVDPSRPEFVMLMVQLHHDVPLDNLYKIADRLGAAAQGPIEGLHGMTVWVPRGQVAELAAIEDVLWVEEGPLPLLPTNDGARATLGVNTVAAAPYNLDGTGVRVFVFDGGAVRATHETFNTGGPSRVTLLDATAANDHPTHVAGTVGGDGAPTSAGGRGRGMAPDVTLLSAGYEQTLGTMLFWDNAGDIQADYALARNTHNADLGTNSIGSNTASNGYPCAREGDYGVTSSLLDGIVRGDNPTVGSPVIMTWANGNERSGGSPRGRCGANYLTTAEPSCAKNPIQVGALNSDGSSMTGFSSWGPCDDGRLKPIVSAPGCETGRVTGETFIYSSFNTSNTAYSGFCGTSMATPATAGVVAMLIEDWRARGFGGATARPLPSLVKAMLIHTARDLGTDGPDFQHGYGLVDAKGVIDLLRAGTGTLGIGTTNWGTDSATHGSLDSYTINVPAGTGELKVSLAWDDAAAAAFTANALVNNLDLELVAPNATLRLPFVLSAANPTAAATTGTNNLDNQEQVVVTNPAAGTWTVRVRGTNIPTGPQTYGLAYGTKAAVGSCTTTTSTYELGNDGWSLGNVTRVAAPAPGHGSSSLHFGNAVNTTHEAFLDVSVPGPGLNEAEVSFWWYMTTQEVAASGFGWDFFTLEVRSTSGAVLAVVDSRSDGYRSGIWQQHQNIDLKRWAGQTVRLVFRATNDTANPTRFWVDDIAVTLCGSSSAPLTATFSSVGAEDGYIVESSEFSNVGGTANGTDNTSTGLRVGDTSADNQLKAFLSFNTAALPDSATILSVTLRLLRGTVVGTNPFTTHGACRVDIENSTGFGGNVAFSASDFQAPATVTNVATMSDSVSLGSFWSEGALNAAGRAAIHKTGITQLRVYLTLDDNDDLGDDYITFYPGETGIPQLVVTYQW